MKVGIKLVKVKKFGIGWCSPHRVVAENAKGGFVRPLPPPHGIGLNLFYFICNCTLQSKIMLEAIALL